MRDLTILLSVIIRFCIVGLVTGCVVVPIPPGGQVNAVEHHIRESLDNGTTRADIISDKNLGPPITEDESSIVYRKCRKGAGVFWVVTLDLLHSPASDTNRGAQECFKITLYFDENDMLSNYDKESWDYSNHYIDNKTPYEIKLNTIKSLAEQGYPDSQWRLYDEYDRKPENAIWLCRSADNGYAKAQLQVGLLYWSAGTITDNKLKAYVWYKLASSGDMLQGLLPDVQTQHEAKMVLREAENVLTNEQLEEAELNYVIWSKGKCANELVPVLYDI